MLDISCENCGVRLVENTKCSQCIIQNNTICQECVNYTIERFHSFCMSYTTYHANIVS